MHFSGSCEASAQYLPINVFVNLFHSKNSNLPHCFSDLIHPEYRELHNNNGHSPFFLPPIMRSSVGQCRNIRFRQLYASLVIITSGRAVKLALEGHNLVYFWFVLYRRNVSITEDMYIYIFGIIVTFLMLDSVISWSLMMR